MKNVLSLLSLAALAMAFAAGCGGKHTECKQATSKEECVEAKFDEGKFICAWDETGATKACVQAPWEANPAAATLCTGHGTVTDAGCAGQTTPANEHAEQKKMFKKHGRLGKCVKVNPSDTACSFVDATPAP